MRFASVEMPRRSASDPFVHNRNKTVISNTSEPEFGRENLQCITIEITEKQ